MSRFCVLGKQLDFHEEIDHWMELYRERLVVDKKICDKYLEAYERAGSMEKVLGEYRQVCANLQDEVIDILYKKLVNFEIYDMSKGGYAKQYGNEYADDVSTMYEIVKADFDILYKEKQYQDRLSHDDPNKLSLTEAIQLNNAIKAYYTKKEKYDDLLLGLRASIATLYHSFSKCVNENFRKYYCYYGDIHDSDKAEALFESAKAVSGEDKRKELLLASLLESPKENPAYEYIIENYGDADNEIERMALFFCPEWKEGEKKKDLLDAFLCEMDYTSKKALMDSLDDVKNRCLYYGMDVKKYIQPVKEIVDKYNMISKTCDGFLYENEEELKSAREELNRFLEMTQNLDANDEAVLLETKKEIIGNFKMKSKEKYSNFLENALQDFDRRYRTVKIEEYSTREEADRIKKQFEKLEAIRNNTDFSSKESIEQSISEMDDVQCTIAEKDIYRILLEESKALLDDAEQLQKRNLCGSRVEQTDVALKTMLISEKYRSMKILNAEFDKFRTEFMDGFKKVMDKCCMDMLSANEEYFKRLSHAQSYAANVVNKNTEKKGIFSKIAGGAKELLSKGYEAEYMYFSDGGKKEIPADSKETGKALEFTIKEEQKRIYELHEQYEAKYADIGYIWNLEPKEITGKSVIADKEFVTKEFVRDTMKKVTEFKSPKSIPDITDIDVIRGNLSSKYTKLAKMKILYEKGNCILERFVQEGQVFGFTVDDQIKLISEDGKEKICDSVLDILEVKGNSQKSDFWRMSVAFDEKQKSLFENKNGEFVWVVSSK